MNETPVENRQDHSGERSGKRCYSLSAIPTKYSKVFPYASFNRIQSNCLYDAWFNKQSLVVAAPTGSGKTGILELAICRAWEDFGQSLLAVYIAPTRSLVRERVSDWRKKFAHLGVRITELTGESNVASPHAAVPDSHLICTTPEKWDVQWRSARRQVSLYLVDEVHCIGEPDRGPLLEAVLTRTVVRPRNKKSPPRFVAVSATIANPEDIGKWLGRNVNYKVREFDASTKPCPVRAVVKGYPCPSAKSTYSFDISLDFKLPAVIMDHAPRGKSTLVFVSTRKAAMQCADRLAKSQSWFTVNTLEQTLRGLEMRLSDRKLIDIVKRGVAFHHAGLSAKDRILVEDAFLRGDVGVLVTTTTLAAGVNLPAYLVVIRGTTLYHGGTEEEYSMSNVLQMIGRAGRIGFESSGQAVIMVKQQNAVRGFSTATAAFSSTKFAMSSIGILSEWAARYEALLAGKLESVESFLQQDLMRHLNAEIALGNVKTTADCVDWLKSTFFYVRAAARSADAQKNEEFELFVGEQIKDALEVLRAHGMILIEEQAVYRTALGNILNRFSLSFGGFSSFIAALRESASQGQLSPKDILWLISALPDFGSHQIRSGEKTILKKLNSKLQYTVTDKPPTWKAVHKTFILLQSQLNSLEIAESTSLRLERISLMKIAKRAGWCLVECILIIWQQPGLRETVGIQVTLSLACNVILVAKSCRCELWYNSEFRALQLDEIGPTRASRLVQNDYVTFESIANAEPGMLEIVTQTKAPFGTRLQQQVRNKIPRYLLHWDLVDGVTVITVDLEHREHVKGRLSCMLLVGDDSDAIHIFKRLSHDELLRTNTFRLEAGDYRNHLKFCLINESMVGVDKDGIIKKPTSDGDQNTVVTPLQATPRSRRSHRGKNSACNSWLMEELEKSAYGENTDAFSAVLDATVEKFLDEYEWVRVSPRERVETILRDSSCLTSLLDDSPDSLEDILDEHYGDSGVVSTGRGFADQPMSASSEMPERINVTEGEAPRTAIPGPSGIKRSALVVDSATPEMGPAKKKPKSGGLSPGIASDVVTSTLGEYPSTSLPPNSRNADSNQRSELENPTDPRTVDCERSGYLEAPLQHPNVETKEPDEWDLYLQDTLANLMNLLPD